MTARSLLGAVVLGAAASASGLARTPIPAEALKAPPPEVRAVGVYEGVLPGGLRRGFREHPPGSVTVAVGPVKAPVVLVLTAYEPVVWNVEAPRGAVARVIASGYYKQAVVGLDKGVPVTLSSYEAGDRDYFYAYRAAAAPTDREHERAETQRKYDHLVDRVRALTGSAPKDLQGAYQAGRFEVR